MTPATSALLDRLTPPGSARRGEPSPTQPARAHAQAWLETNGLPTFRDEAWKYTPLSEILAAPFDPAPELSHNPFDIAMIDELAGDHGGPRLVFVNGGFVAALSRHGRLPAGIVCRAQAASDIDPQGCIDPGPIRIVEQSRVDGFQALNQLAGRDGAVILVDPDTRLSEPIHVVHLSAPGGTPLASHPRTLLHASEKSEVTFIETYAGLSGRGLTNAVTTIVAGPGAIVTHHKIQAEAAGAFHLAHTRITQSAGSKVQSHSYLLGADVARNAVDVVLNGANAQVELEGLYLATTDQHHDNVITVEHAASGCTSRQLFKGVIDDGARGSFSGRIIVQPGTTATDAAQTSRSLLLAPTAEADTRPWLEIFADDVKCTHGATVGRLDAEAMFYLRTRGIAEADARTLLIGGFIAEMTEAVRPATLRSHLDASIAGKRSPGAPGRKL